MYCVKEVLLLAGVIHFATGFQPSDFHDWYLQSSIIIDHWLYIVGGDLITDDATIHSMQYTYSIDLSESWTTSDVQPEATDSSSVVTPIKGPMVWYNPAVNQVKMWGGLTFTGSQSPGSYSFSPVESGGVVWDEAVVPSDNGSPLDALWGSAYATSPTTFYGIGGTDTKDGVVTPVTSMFTEDFESGIWTNNTNADGFASRLTFDSKLNFVPNFGNAGLLIALSGESFENQSSYTLGDVVGFQSVDVYDIDSNSWYSQQTTGEIPLPVYDFCAVGLESEDQGSYEIYIFGGGTLNDTYDDLHWDDTAYKDVYILSLPAFTWVRVDRPSEIRRRAVSCQVIGNSQMLFIGGNFFANDDRSKVDPWPNGMAIFDMTSLEWTDGNYNHSAASYQRASSVQAIYQQNSTPTWDDPALATLFPFRNSLTTPTSTGNTTTTTTPQPTSLPSPTKVASHSKSSHAGAIAGGVIGGIAAIALIAAALYFLRRRRRQPSGQQQSEEQQSGEQRSGEHYTGKDDTDDYDSATKQRSHTDALALEMPGETTSRSELHGQPDMPFHEKEAVSHGRGYYESQGPGITPELPGDTHVAR